MVLAEVADLIPAAARPLLVAVDGPDGSGKTWFADELADTLRERRPDPDAVIRASIDDFHQPRAFRHALGRTPETVWSRSFDHRAVRRELLDPWLAGSGAGYRRRWHDLATDQRLCEPPDRVPEGGVLVVDGVFAQRPEFADAWDLTIYLQAPPQVTVARMAARDGSDPDPKHPDQQRYLAAQARYRELFDPVGTADIVIDNADLQAPAILADELPAGWERVGDRLVRTLNIPAGRTDLAGMINALTDS